jgi:L-alanine-DL-glutamate epimerase-like enolase superfamily enzyme
MACLQVVAQSRAGWILEWAKGIHYNTSGATAEVDPWLRYIVESDWHRFELNDAGHLTVPGLPGLGVRINWDEVQRAAKTAVVWRDAAMFLADGTIANW